MGIQYQATCKNCGKEFTANIGGGFRFELLYCNTCGKEKSIDIEKFQEDRIYPCRCGGIFRPDAKPPCPKCKSKDWDGVKVLYYD